MAGPTVLKSTPNNRFFEKLFRVILVIPRIFAKKLLRENRRNSFRIFFWCLAWGSNPRLSSNKPTHYLIDYSGCKASYRDLFAEFDVNWRVNYSILERWWCTLSAPGFNILVCTHCTSTLISWRFSNVTGFMNFAINLRIWGSVGIYLRPRFVRHFPAIFDQTSLCYGNKSPINSNAAQTVNRFITFSGGNIMNFWPNRIT